MPCAQKAANKKATVQAQAGQGRRKQSLAYERPKIETSTTKHHLAGWKT